MYNFVNKFSLEIYTTGSVQFLDTCAQRLIGGFTTFLAQITTASRLLFASIWHVVPRECEKIWQFSDFLIFSDYVP